MNRDVGISLVVGALALVGVGYLYWDTKRAEEAREHAEEEARVKVILEKRAADEKKIRIVLDKHIDEWKACEKISAEISAFESERSKAVAAGNATEAARFERSADKARDAFLLCEITFFGEVQPDIDAADITDKKLIGEVLRTWEEEHGASTSRWQLFELNGRQR